MLRAVKQLVGTSLSLATSPVRAAADRLLPAPSEDAEDADADGLEPGLERLEATIEEGLERVGTAVEESIELFEDSLGLHRRVWEEEAGEDHAHAQIEVHGLEDPDASPLRRRLARTLQQLDQVRWAEVNALTGRVAVSFDGGGSTLNRLLEVIDGLEEAYDIRRTGNGSWDDHERADHPGDDEPVHRAIAIISGDVLSLGWAVAGRVARLARIPVELGGLLSVVDNQPVLRARVERVLGKRPTALLLPLASAAAVGIAQGPLGVMVDLAHQATLLGELRARRHVWHEREPELHEGPDESLGAALNRTIAIRGTATALGATAAWTAARLTGTQRRASSVGLLALVGAQLGQTVVAGGWRHPATLLTGVGSAVGLGAIVQTPGLSQFFGSRPVGPIGLLQASSGAVAATVGSQVASWAFERGSDGPRDAADDRSG